MADAASAVIGHEASVSKPGSRAGPVLTVTVQCQTAILSFSAGFFFFFLPLKSASSQKQHRLGPSGSRAGGSGQGKAVSDILRGTLGRGVGDEKASSKHEKMCKEVSLGFALWAELSLDEAQVPWLANYAEGHFSANVCFGKTKESVLYQNLRRKPVMSNFLTIA